MLSSRLLCFFYFFILNSNCELLPSSPPEALVEPLIQNYLSEEDKLWTLIENRAENVLQQIYQIHEDFLSDVVNKSKSGIFHKDFSVPQCVTLSSTAFSFDTASNEVYRILRRKQYNSKDEEHFKDATSWFLGRAAELFQITNDAYFWKSILPVSKECRHMMANESSGQITFDYYKDIQTLLLNSYIVAQLSNMVTTYYQGNSEKRREQSSELKTTFTSRTSRIKDLATEYLSTTNLEVRACDLPMSDMSLRYAEITNFLQGYVDNEVNLNEQASCTADCAYYGKTRHYACAPESPCRADKYGVAGTVCDGVLRDCETIDYSELRVCEVNNENRRYDGIEHSGGNTAGHGMTSCMNTVTAMSWVRWFVKCSNCFCLCETSNDRISDRYISLREVVSNIENNKIVTAVTFLNKKSIVHLGIIERKLLPYGQTEPQIIFRPQPIKPSHNKLFATNDLGVEENIDYHKLTYENRSFNLDTLTAPPGHLVTGVRFRISNGHITLEIRATPFDYQSGALKNLEDSKWISNLDGGQTKISLKGSGDPLKCSKHPIVNETPNAFVEFGPTGYWADVGQLTIPYFDTQVVEPYKPVPLSGIGLFFKGQPGFGGFIAPKLIVYPFKVGN